MRLYDTVERCSVSVLSPVIFRKFVCLLTSLLLLVSASFNIGDEIEQTPGDFLDRWTEARDHTCLTNLADATYCGQFFCSACCSFTAVATNVLLAVSFKGMQLGELPKERTAVRLLSPSQSLRDAIHPLDRPIINHSAP